VHTHSQLEVPPRGHRTSLQLTAPFFVFDQVYCFTVSHVDMQRLRITLYDQDLGLGGGLAKLVENLAPGEKHSKKVNIKTDNMIGMVQGGLKLAQAVESLEPVAVTADLVQHSSSHSVRKAGDVSMELFYLPFPGGQVRFHLLFESL
jgi:hypothetical protein